MNEKAKRENAPQTQSILEILQNLLRNLGGRLIAGLLAAIAAAFFFGWLADEVFEGETRFFDEAVRQAVHQTASPPLTSAMIFFTYLGSVYGITTLFICALIILLRLRHKCAAVVLLITMAGEVALDIALKNSFQRTRPAPFFDFPSPASYSFPSGHAFAALCFFGATAWLFASRAKNRTARTSIWCAALFLILMIGLSRVYLGVHFPSDVLAGYSAGLIWLLTVVFGDWWWRRKKSSK